MNSLPPELHSYIFSLACSDDGFTARSLVQTSSYFLGIAAPLRYRSLSILGARQLIALAVRLGNTPLHLRHVQHLFLRDTVQPASEEILDARTFHRFLLLVAPTLKSFAYVSNNPATMVPTIASLFRTSFPRLEELWISGYYPFPTLAGKFPLLKRLHLNGNRNPHGLLQTGNLDEACPSLTHLHISGLNMAITFALELESALNGDDTHLFPSTLPPLLRSVVVQPGPAPPQAAKPTTGQLKDELMDLHLVRMSSTPVVKGVSVMCLNRKAIGADEIKQDWLDALRCAIYCDR